MKKAKSPEKLDVVYSSTWLVEDPVFLAGGFAIPRAFTVHVQRPDGTKIDIDVEIDGRPRAVARKITVTPGTGGVKWISLAGIPVRELVATACMNELHRGRTGKDGKTEWIQGRAPGPDALEEVRQIVQGLVGYQPRGKR